MVNRNIQIFNYKYKLAIEELFGMRTGYVLDFSNNTFERFVFESVGIGIYSDQGYEEYTSKANKLRQILNNENSHIVAKLVLDLLDYCENYKLKLNKLTEYDRKIIKEIKDICLKHVDDYYRIKMPDDLNKKIELISTRNATFEQMPADEKIKELGNLIEFMLKGKNGFASIDYSFSSDLINERSVIEFRRKIQCFRHSSEESINERNSFTMEQKSFLIEYGILLNVYIYNQISK